MKSTLLIVLAVIASYASGMILGYGLREVNLVPSKPPKLACDNSPGIVNNAKERDLDDIDILLVTTEKPTKIFHINHIKNKVQDYYQTQLVYSDIDQKLRSVAIPPTSVSYKQLTDKQSNTAYTFSANFVDGNNSYRIYIPYIDMYMTIRAQPDVGKYGGSTTSNNATITINGTTHAAYAAVTTGFFNKFVPVDTSKLKVKTNWLMFWDKDWNFYHLDQSQVGYPTKDYYSHTFFARENASAKNVQYFGDVNINENNNEITTISANGDVDIILNKLITKEIYPKAKESFVTSSTGGIGILINLDATK